MVCSIKEVGLHENLYFNKANFKVLHPVQDNPKYDFKLDKEWIENNSANYVHLQPRKLIKSWVTSKEV